MFNIKHLISKRIHPWPNTKYYILKSLKGFRPINPARSWGSPIDCTHSSHIHVYMTLTCDHHCRYCINRQIAGGIPDIPAERDPVKWINLLNRLYNTREIYFNGGEHFLLPYFAEVVNGIRDQNLLIFTNLPEDGMEQIRALKPNNNNIFLDISYHVVEEDPVNIFIDRLKQIPKGIIWNIHIVKDPRISPYLFLDAFRRHGIYGTEIDCIYYPELRHETVQTVLCKTHEKIIGPDMRRYGCLMHLLYRNQRIEIDVKEPDKKWPCDWQYCDLYPRCKLDSAYQDIKYL